MVVETRIRSSFARFNEDGGADCSSSVRLRCTVTVKHASQRLRGNGLAVPDRVKQHDQPMSGATWTTPPFSSGPDDTLRAAHDMLVSMTQLRDLDLSPANWQPEEDDGCKLPQRVALWLHDQGCQWLLGGGERRSCRFEVEAGLLVTLVFNEPRAVLQRCAEVAMQTLAPGSDEECGICLDEFSDAGKSEPINLPCSHAFHVHCMLAWLDRGTNCPACRYDLRGMVGTAPWTPASSGTARRRWRG